MARYSGLDSGAACKWSSCGSAHVTAIVDREASVGFQWPVFIPRDAPIDSVHPPVHPFHQLLPLTQQLPAWESFIQPCRDLHRRGHIQGMNGLILLRSSGLNTAGGGRCERNGEAADWNSDYMSLATNDIELTGSV